MAIYQRLAEVLGAFIVGWCGESITEIAHHNITARECWNLSCNVQIQRSDLHWLCCGEEYGAPIAVLPITIMRCVILNYY